MYVRESLGEGRWVGRWPVPGMFHDVLADERGAARGFQSSTAVAAPYATQKSVRKPDKFNFEAALAGFYLNYVYFYFIAALNI